ncbi:MAG: hypothetical protein GXP46_08530 [Deferribacteres bacterium]|nr:hypothetical protein [Deferribacteres bacterium]
MKKHFGLSILAFFIGLMITAAGCGPVTFTRVRVDYQPYALDENKQTKEGITIERHFLKSLPPEFIAKAQKCDPATGGVSVGANGKPVMEETSLLPKGAMIDKFSITNNTGHIIRLNSTVIAVFDPADNQFRTLSKEEIFSYLMQERPCQSTRRLQGRLNIIKLISRNTELLPGRTTTGYLVYKPYDKNIPGVWKLSFYELPVKTNAAGVVTKTVNFEFRSVARKFLDTYKWENILSKPVRISSEEIR